MFIPGVETNRPRGRDFNHAKPIDYAVGLTPCEPAEVFSEGEVFDPLAPPQLYDEKGLPLCCINIMNVKGGVLWGGSADLSFETVDPGPTCEESEQGEWGTWYEWDCPAGEEQWWYFPDKEPTTMGFEVQGCAPIGFDYRFGVYVQFAGGGCPGALAYASSDDSDHQQNIFASPLYTQAWVKVINGGTMTMHYRFRVQQTPF